MSDYGLKITLPGYDIATATPEQCAVHSSYPNFKSKTNQANPHFATVSVDFTAKVTQNTTLTLYSFVHGYTYRPFSLSNLTFDDGAGTSVTGIGSVGIGANLNIQAYCDATSFYITIFDNFSWTSSAASLIVSYYVFCEDGT
jgi:hypothetical protein